MLQKEVGCGQLWLVCACADTDWCGFLTCDRSVSSEVLSNMKRDCGGAMLCYVLDSGWW